MSASPTTSEGQMVSIDPKVGKKIETIGRRVNQMIGLKSGWDAEAEAITKTVGIDKAHLNIKDKVKEVFEGLQFQMHQQTVGQFEALLTAALHEIFDIEDKVIINISMARQAVQLDINAITPDGDLEDIINGRGGSVANVLSAGLRFIALTRSGLRPFIVFDESDCWIRPDKVARFNSMIYKMSTELGVQALVISHHEEDYFGGLADLIYVQKSNGSLSATSLPNTWADDQEGVRSIYLEDCMSYERSAITLSPHVTGIIGHNEAGKSNVVEALRALFDGYRSDSIIRHKKEKCLVEVDLGPQGILSYERSRKGSRRTTYRLRQGNQIIHESKESTPPEWIKSLGFGMSSGVDIQLGHQKKPIFMLDETDSKKAAILSIGHESGHLDKMQSLYKKLTKEREFSVKEGEKRLGGIEKKHKVTHGLPDLSYRVKEVKKTWLTLEKEVEDLKVKFTLLAQLSACQAKVNELKALPNQSAIPSLPEVKNVIHEERAFKALLAAKAMTARLSVLPVVPMIAPLPELNERSKSKLSDQLNKLSSLNSNRLIEKTNAIKIDELPELKDPKAIRSLGKKLILTRSTLRALANMMVSSPTLPLLAPLKDPEMINKLNNFHEQIIINAADAKKVFAEEKQGEALIAKLMDKIDVCPLCHLSTNEHEHKNAA